MADRVNRQTRSRIMSRIRGKDTKPELLIRSALHRLGFRFRLHYRWLPGSPDIVLPKYRAAIAINGCFWHGHSCHLFKWPQSRVDFWKEKIATNQVRDEKNLSARRDQGWRTLTIWECAIQGRRRIELDELMATVEEWLTSGTSDDEIEGR